MSDSVLAAQVRTTRPAESDLTIVNGGKIGVLLPLAFDTLLSVTAPLLISSFASNIL